MLPDWLLGGLINRDMNSAVAPLESDCCPQRRMVLLLSNIVIIWRVSLKRSKVVLGILLVMAQLSHDKVLVQVTTLMYRTRSDMLTRLGSLVSGRPFWFKTTIWYSKVAILCEPRIYLYILVFFKFTSVQGKVTACTFLQLSPPPIFFLSQDFSLKLFS